MRCHHMHDNGRYGYPPSRSRMGAVGETERTKRSSSAFLTSFPSCYPSGTEKGFSSYMAPCKIPKTLTIAIIMPDMPSGSPAAPPLSTPLTPT